MARTPAQRGRIGNWLVESRLARGYDSQAKACAAIRRLTGWAVNRSQYASWESGDSVPKDENLARLEAFYGPLPAERTAATIGSDTAIVAALERQTAMIERQAVAIEQLTGVLSEGLLRMDATLMGQGIGFADALGLLAAALAPTPSESETGSAARRARRDHGSASENSRTAQ